jgi:hypothetical protein
LQSSLTGQEGAIGGEQIRHQLASHRQRRSIAVSALLFGLEVGLLELFVQHGGDLGRFDPAFGWTRQSLIPRRRMLSLSPLGGMARSRR